MKAKMIKSNPEKNSFMYRLQDADNPMLFRFFEKKINSKDNTVSMSGYIQIPNNVMEDINNNITSLVGQDYKIIQSAEYDSTSMSIKIFEPYSVLIGEANCYISDIIIEFKPFTYKDKVHCVHWVKELIISNKKHSYLVGDDYFDDIISEHKQTPIPDCAQSSTQTTEDDDLPF